MSIPLREGFVDETLERCLEDLLVRFVVNCPEEDLSSIERVLFQIEEAHWFYQDFLRTLNPLLPSMKMKQFTNRLIEQCPLIWKWGDPSEALALFGKYKSTIPVRGCALLNPTLDKMLLVKGIESSSWGFPRGKISKGESDLDCALRELEEETGFNAADLIDEDIFVERTIKGKNYKIYIVKGVPETTKFVPQVRFEIADIKWMDIKYLTKAVKNTSNFYLVGAMFKPIVSYINRIKNTESDEELKKLATIQLKKILGIDEFLTEEEEKETADPGRELLSMLQSATKVPSTLDNATTSPSSGTPLSQQQQQQQQTLEPQGAYQQPSLSMLPPYLQHIAALQHLAPHPQLLAYHQSRMGAIPPHNPFALQMFNPYLAMPQYGMPFMNQSNNRQAHPQQSLPQSLQHHSLEPQGMAIGPSASSFSKPQFAISNKKPNTANSKELLGILKSKPKPQEQPKPKEQENESSSAALLNILKSAPSRTSTSTSPNTPIRILKRKKPTEEALKVEEVDNSPKRDENEKLNPQIAHQKTQVVSQQPLDITKPANESTARDIINPVSDRKPIVLLRKSTPNGSAILSGSNSPALESKSSLMNSLAITEVAQPIEAKRDIVQEIQTPQMPPSNNSSSSRKHDTVSLESLSFLTNPNGNNNSDPSSQLLGLLKKSPPTAQTSSSVPEKATSGRNSDLSASLLHLLHGDTILNEKPNEKSDPSTALLGLLKGGEESDSLELAQEHKSAEPSAAELSNGLLELLKSKSPTPSSSAVASPSQMDGSASLLHLLHRDSPPVNTDERRLQYPTMTPPQPQTQPQTQPQQTPSSFLLDILKKPNTSPSRDATTTYQNSSASPHVMQSQFNMGNESHVASVTPENPGVNQYGLPQYTQQQYPNQSQYGNYQQNSPQSMEQKIPNVNSAMSDSSSLLNILKGSHANTPSQQPQITSVQTVPHDASAAIMELLKVPSDSVNTDTVSKNFDDFEDFEDDDGEIEGEYIMNGGLYEDE